LLKPVEIYMLYCKSSVNYRAGPVYLEKPLGKTLCWVSERWVSWSYHGFIRTLVNLSSFVAYNLRKFHAYEFLTI